MISRRTATLIAALYEAEFGKYWSATRSTTLEWGRAYDFLFEHDHDAWLCNAIRATGSHKGTRRFKEFIMQLHTGESLAACSSEWSWEQRQAKGRAYLEKMAEDILNHLEGDTYPSRGQDPIRNELVKSLRLDGYDYEAGCLAPSETDVLDVAEKRWVIRGLYSELELAEEDTAFHHLDLSEEHYFADRWDDSIGNSRKFLECVLREVAKSHSLTHSGSQLPNDKCQWAGRVRQYLAEANLLTAKEKDALSSAYGLLSETGSHPYVAAADQARLVRQMALIWADFILLRYRGWKTQGP